MTISKPAGYAGVEAIAEFYGEPAQVDDYSNKVYLELPELALLHELGAQDGPLEMLDIGVGAGRTSLFFTAVVSQYTGIDIAEPMVDACRRRLAGLRASEHARFAVGDAIDLADFADGQFDLVLFSFNGIDCIPDRSREACLRSIRRVLRPGGRFVFSSHNIRNIETYYRPVIYRQPSKMLHELDRLRKIRRNNGPRSAFRDKHQVSFWDGVYDDAGMKHVFVTAEHQVGELERLGFSDVVVRSRDTGRPLEPHEIVTTTEPWVYFFCVRSD